MTLPIIETGIKHYNEIPRYCIIDAKSILDIGCSNGIMAHSSKYRSVFERVNNNGLYLGVDIQHFSYNHYFILQHDILSFVPKIKYDLIILSHVLEHIDIIKWESLLSKLYNNLEIDGYLVINVPFRERPQTNIHKNTEMEHKTFLIDKQTLEWFLPDGKYFYFRDKWLYLREKGEFLPYAILRFIYRALTNHPYSVFNQKGKLCDMIGVWKKKDDRKRF